MDNYYNYHKHDDYSNIKTPDVAIQFDDYIDRAIELGHNAVFTTNHGVSTDVFYAYDKCKENGLDMIFGIEVYITKYVEEKERGKHMIMIALNKQGYKDINKLNSRANTEGFYYHPRLQLDWLLEIDPTNVIVTSACVNSVLKIDGALHLLRNHFGDNFYLEVQNHNEDIQKDWNLKILEYHEQYDIPLIHANDSHYIYPTGYKGRDGRDLFLSSKGMSYGDEDNFILDYPDYDTVLDRYVTQGILTKEQARASLDNTMVFDKAKDLDFKKNIKMPTIYKDLSFDERYNKLQNTIIDEWTKEREKLKKYNLTDEDFQEYNSAIMNELKVVKETNDEVHTADYFLLNYEIVKRATSMYDGCLTFGGRGSAVSYYLNYLLKFTKIDRVLLQKDVPIYPSRFISKTRLLETKSLADIDFNTTDSEPFYKATQDILGKNHVYPMISYGRLKKSGSFRMVCRAKNIPMTEYNSFAKSIGDVEDEILLGDDRFGELYKASKNFYGLIESSSIHPCSYLVYNEPIDEEIGLTRSGDHIVCNITSGQSDKWKFLKEDFLETDDIRILKGVEDMGDIETIEIRELIDNLDEETWKLYEDGITATLNQASTEHSRNLVMKYKPKSYAEYSSFVSAIRPNFSTLLNGFLNRVDYSIGVDELDKLFENTNHYILYQENIMQFLIHLGVPEDESYSILKRIAKKDETLTEYLNELEGELYIEWCNKGYTKDKFKDSWKIVLNSVGYGFNASHAVSTAIISLYQAYYKRKYPLEYYSVTLGMYEGVLDKTNDLVSELDYFDIGLKPITFGKSRGGYFPDRENRIIYKGIGSIKYLNSNIGDELYELSQNNTYTSFIDLLYDLSNTSMQSNQLEILIRLDFFNEFGNDKKLLTTYKIFDTFNGRKQLNKETNANLINIIKKLGVSEEYIKANTKETEKLYKNFDFKPILFKMETNIPNSEFTVKEKIGAQLEYLTYINKQYDIDVNIWVVTDISTYKNPYLDVHNIRTGKSKKLKLFKYDIDKNNGRPEIGNFIRVDKSVWQRKNVKQGDEWVKSKDKQLVLKKYFIIK